MLVAHYSDVIASTMASEITSVFTVYSIVCSGADQRKHQSPESPAFVWGIRRWPVNSPHKWPVTRKMHFFDDEIMIHFMIVWWLQDTLSTLQDIFREINRWPVDSPPKWRVMRSFDVLLWIISKKFSNKQLTFGWSETPWCLCISCITVMEYPSKDVTSHDD